MVKSGSESSSGSQPDFTLGLKAIKKSKKKDGKHKKSKKEKKKHKKKHKKKDSEELESHSFPIIPELLGHSSATDNILALSQNPESIIAAVDRILFGDEQSDNHQQQPDGDNSLPINSDTVQDNDTNLVDLLQQKKLLQLQLVDFTTNSTGDLTTDDAPPEAGEIDSESEVVAKSGKGSSKTRKKKHSSKKSSLGKEKSRKDKESKKLHDHHHHSEDEHETPSKKFKSHDKVKIDDYHDYEYRTESKVFKDEPSFTRRNHDRDREDREYRDTKYRWSLSPSRNYNNNRDRDMSRNDDNRSGGGYRDRRYDNGRSERDKERDRGRDVDRRDYRSSKDYRSYSRDSRISRPSDRDFYRDGGGDRGSYRSYRGSRSRSRSPSEIIDKAKLLEIARRNATLLMKQGVLPTDIFSRDQIMAIKAGGKSVEELTSYCRKLARKDSRTGGDDQSDDNSDADEEHFIHHPFVVKDRPMPQITLNIRNAIPLPVRTPQELAIENAVRKTQFPVSSGAQHRYKELEWKVVDKDDEKLPKDDQSKALVPLESVGKEKAVKPPKATSQPTSEITQECDSSTVVESSSDKKPEPEIETGTDTGITVEPPMLPHVDISSVISARLKAMRALKENPESEEAKKLLDGAVEEMNQWAQAKALEPKFLTVSDLTTGPQAWAKKDQLKNAKEVASGMGMHLLQKMGWRPGEGLGKNKEGTTEPLALDVKTDKKGLTSQADLKGPQANVFGLSARLYELAGKHPVSALMELCTKRRWGPPSFELCFEHGPPHQKQFVFKVVVNGVEYQPCIATNNKKLAKANAAAFCLQSLGLLKTTPAPGPSHTLSTTSEPIRL